MAPLASDLTNLVRVVLPFARLASTTKDDRVRNRRFARPGEQDAGAGTFCPPRRAVLRTGRSCAHCESNPKEPSGSQCVRGRLSLASGSFSEPTGGRVGRRALNGSPSEPSVGWGRFRSTFGLHTGPNGRCGHDRSLVGSSIEPTAGAARASRRPDRPASTLEARPARERPAFRTTDGAPPDRRVERPATHSTARGINRNAGRPMRCLGPSD